jgi:hypothetical protein
MVFALSRYNRELCNQIMPPVMKSLISRQRNNSANATAKGTDFSIFYILRIIQIDFYFYDFISLFLFAFPP